jgi:hypothetical protein
MHVPAYDGLLVKCDDCGNDRIPLFVTSGCEGCREAASTVQRINREFGAAEIARGIRKMMAEDSGGSTPDTPHE